jgi:hypothetical protein
LIGGPNASGVFRVNYRLPVCLQDSGCVRLAAPFSFFDNATATAALTAALVQTSLYSRFYKAAIHALVTGQVALKDAR